MNSIKDSFVYSIFLILLFIEVGESKVQNTLSDFTQNESYTNLTALPPVLRAAFAKQVGLPTNPVGFLMNRVPCTCQNGHCGCCTGSLLSAFSTKGCMNITYIPEDFAFEIKMLMNDAVLYTNKLTGRNPPPICVRPPRFSIIEVCATFYDLYFAGRNMHVCLDMNGYFQSYELFNRSFNCMRIGDKGVKIVKPDDDSEKPSSSSSNNDADVDEGDDDIEDYDENLLRRALMMGRLST